MTTRSRIVAVSFVAVVALVAVTAPATAASDAASTGDGIAVESTAPGSAGFAATLGDGDDDGGGGGGGGQCIAEAHRAIGTCTMF